MRVVFWMTLINLKRQFLFILISRSLVEQMQNDIQEWQKNVRNILKYARPIKQQDAEEAIKIISYLQEQLVQFSKYCGELDFIFKGQLTEVKFNDGYLRHKFDAQVIQKLEPLKKLLRVTFPQVIAHIASLGKMTAVTEPKLLHNVPTINVPAIPGA